MFTIQHGFGIKVQIVVCWYHHVQIMYWDCISCGRSTFDVYWVFNSQKYFFGWSKKPKDIVMGLLRYDEKKLYYPKVWDLDNDLFTSTLGKGNKARCIVTSKTEASYLLIEMECLLVVIIMIRNCPISIGRVYNFWINCWVEWSVSLDVIIYFRLSENGFII